MSPLCLNAKIAHVELAFHFRPVYRYSNYGVLSSTHLYIQPGADGTLAEADVTTTYWAGLASLDMTAMQAHSDPPGTAAFDALPPLRVRVPAALLRYFQEICQRKIHKSGDKVLAFTLARNGEKSYTKHQCIQRIHIPEQDGHGRVLGDLTQLDRSTGLYINGTMVGCFEKVRDQSNPQPAPMTR